MADSPATERQPLADTTNNANISHLPKPTCGINGEKSSSGPILAPGHSKKRKSSGADADDGDISHLIEDCDKLRGFIRDCISCDSAPGEAHFISVIGVTSEAFTSFMSQEGADAGKSSNVYIRALLLYKELEVKCDEPPVKKAKLPKVDAEKSKTFKMGVNSLYNVTEIELDGEEQGEVEVYDTCDVIRRRITKWLARSEMTQSGFVREISKTYGGSRNISTTTLKTFLGKKGAAEGNTSPVFYAAYVFFEKVRIRDGEKKTKFRLLMEEEWEVDGGFDLKRLDDLVVPASFQGEYYIDKFGPRRNSEWDR